jgi:hypothetical protein
MMIRLYDCILGLLILKLLRMVRVTSEDFHGGRVVPSGPSYIILLRHGEKPPDARQYNLSEHGAARAAALTVYFPAFLEKHRLPRPAAFYAQSSKNEMGGTKSKRAVETLTPTAKVFGQDVIESFARDDFTALAADIMSSRRLRQKTAIICWERHALVKLIKHLGFPDMDHWPADVFDWTIVLQFRADGTPQTLKKHLQRLMFGDRV